MGMKSLSSDFVTDLKRSNGELTAELARAKAELDEAHQREAATAAVLKAISRSTFDLQKVLDTLVEAAARLCGADHAVLRRRIGNENRLAATFGIRAEWLEHIARHPTTPGRHSIVGRAMLEGRTVQSADVLEDPEFADLRVAEGDRLSRDPRDAAASRWRGDRLDRLLQADAWISRRSRSS